MVPWLAIVLASSPPAGTLAAGTYALEVEVVAAVDVPFIGMQRTRTHTLSHVVVDENAAAIAVLCAMDTIGPAFSFHVPEASLRGLRVARFPLELDHEAGTVRGDMGRGTLGYEGDGGLPEHDRDPRVRDVDGDGLPGMRVDVVLGPLGEHTVQMVAMGHTVLDGFITHDGAAGRVRVTNAERVLSGLPFRVRPAKSRIDAGKSRFRMKRVVAASCDELGRVSRR